MGVESMFGHRRDMRWMNLRTNRSTQEQAMLQRYWVVTPLRLGCIIMLLQAPMALGIVRKDVLRMTSKTAGGGIVHEKKST